MPTVTDAEDFERVLAADAYALFGEVRDLAGTLNSAFAEETLAPYAQLGVIPRETTLLREFITRHAEALSSARISFAAQPGRPDLPTVLLRIRLADEQTARALTEPLRRLLRQLSSEPSLQPVVTPAPVAADAVTTTPPPKPAGDSQAAARRASPPVKPADDFALKQHGAALFVSNAEFDVSALKTANDAPMLADSANFQTVRARFAAAPLFVYYNLETADREIRRMTEERALRAKNDSSTQEVESVVAVDPTMSGAMTKNTDAPPDDLTLSDPVPVEAVAAPPVVAAPEAGQEVDLPPTANVDGASEGDINSSIAMPALGLMLPSIMGGANGIVDSLGGAKAMGAGLTIEASEMAVRVMLVTPEGGTIKPVPFMPVLVGGAPAAAHAAAMLPADTDLFFNLSVDLSRSYDEALAAFDAAARRSTGSPEARAANAALGSEDEAGNKAGTSALGINLIEQRYGFKIKDELLASLGGEIAVGVLRAQPPPSTTEPTATVSTAIGTTTIQPAVADQAPTTNGAGEGGTIVIISVTDRERLKRLLPRVLEAAGMKVPAGADSAVVANMFRKQGDIETIQIGGGGDAAAFIGDYLVVATGGASLDRIARIARGEGSSLSSVSEFTSARTWQPRDKLAEAYISGGIAESLFLGERRSLIGVAGELKSYFEQFAGTTPEPFTYALSAEPQGTLHEIRVPRSTLVAFGAYMAADSKHGAKMRNERYAAYSLISLAESEKAYREKHNRYGSIQDLRKAELYWQDDITVTGYQVDLKISADSFRVIATPTEHNVTGRRSFYIDQNGTLRGADHGGRPATAADPEAQP